MLRDIKLCIELFVYKWVQKLRMNRVKMGCVVKLQKDILLIYFCIILLGLGQGGEWQIGKVGQNNNLFYGYINYDMCL